MSHIPVQNAQHLAQEVLRRSARHVDQMEVELRRHDCADPECQLHVVTEPGVYDLPTDSYHADPVPDGSLSHSGARLLLPPNCPAIFAHRREHGREPKREWDLGHAAHRQVLGTGPDIVRVDADAWRTHAAKAARDAARDAGKVPLLAADHDEVLAMAAALAAHPIAGKLFQPGTGKAEQSLFWRDRQLPEVWRRARLDWLPEPGQGRPIIPDYKTTRSADLEHIGRAMHDYGYHIQAAWSLDGLRALGLVGTDAVWVLVVQERTPPYLVTVAQPDPAALRIGRILARDAINTFAECTRTGQWPAYATGVEQVSLPHWVAREFGEDL